jgi:Zn finger protein HypA/HybF involved in hydrogenase expression
MALTKEAVKFSLEAIEKGAVLEGDKIRPVFS